LSYFQLSQSSAFGNVVNHGQDDSVHVTWPYCAAPENIHTLPTEGIGISWGVGDSEGPTNLKKCMKLDWNFQRGKGVGEGVLEKIPSVVEVWIFMNWE